VQAESGRCAPSTVCTRPRRYRSRIAASAGANLRTDTRFAPARAAPDADRGVYAISVAAEMVGMGCRRCACTRRGVCFSPTAPLAAPAATAPTIWTGCAVSATCSTPGSTWPASAWCSTWKTRTRSFVQRRRNRDSSRQHRSGDGRPGRRPPRTTTARHEHAGDRHWARAAERLSSARLGDRRHDRTSPDLRRKHCAASQRNAPSMRPVVTTGHAVNQIGLFPVLRFGV
jgi:hypothetical protein